MPLLKFQTVGKEKHRMGRVALVIDIDKKLKKLFVSVEQAKGLNGDYVGQDIKPEFVHFRLQLLPHQNPMLVTQSLMQPTVQESNYKRKTTVHHTTGNPELHEDFVFDLSEAWDFIPDFRFFVQCLCQGRNGLEFAGLTSFALAELVASSSNKRPRWWWLLSESAGLHKSEAVEQRIVQADISKLKPDVSVDGRLPELAFALINGVYTWQQDECNGKPTWKQGNKSVYLYFHRKKQAWCIADCLNSTAPFAYMESSSTTPDRETEQVWMVYNLERKQIRGKPSETDKLDELGTYEPDTGIYCKRRSVVGRVKAGNERGRQIIKLISSQEQFTDSLAQLRLYSKEYENVLLDDDYPGGHAAIFDALTDLEKVNMFFYEQLIKGQTADPRFEDPIGNLLVHMARLFKAPFLNYCNELGCKVEVVSSLPVRSNLGNDDSMNAAKAMEIPFLQIQRYPHYIMAIMKASELDMKASMAYDLQVLRQALTAFQAIASTALQAARVTRELPKKMNPVDGAIVPGNAPVWFHGILDVSQAVELLSFKPHGTFLVRQSPGKNPDYPFSLGLVVHNPRRDTGIVVHHKIRREKDGRFLFKDIESDFGGAMSLVDLIDALRVPRDDWRIRLREFLPRNDAKEDAIVKESEKVSALLIAAKVDPEVLDKIEDIEAEDPYQEPEPEPEPTAEPTLVPEEQAEPGPEVIQLEAESELQPESVEVEDTPVQNRNESETVVTIPKPVGIAFQGSPTAGLFVTKIKPDGNAEKVGDVAIGHIVISIQGVTMAGKSKKDLSDMIKATSSPVEFVFLEDKERYNAFLESKSTAENASQKEFEVLVDKPHGISWGGDKKLGLFVANVKAGSNAEKTGVITKGLRLESFNGTIVKGKSRKDLAGEIKETVGKILTFVFINDETGFAQYLKKQEQRNSTTGNDAPGILIKKPLGLNFDGSEDAGLFVTKVKPGSNAKAMGVKVGAKFVSVNGQSVAGKNKASVTQMIKSTEGDVKVEFTEDPGGFENLNNSKQEKRKEPASSTPGPVTNISDEYNNMGRLQLIKILRTRQIDYKGTKDIEKLRALARDSDTPSSSDQGGQVNQESQDLSLIVINKPLGLSFDGNGDIGFFVTKVKPGGNAESSGKIGVGAKITEVLGVDPNQYTKKELTARIKSYEGEVTLKVANDPNGFAAFQESKTSPVSNDTNKSGDIELTKPLGMSFDGTKKLGYYVTKIKAGGSADNSGKIKIGDRIVNLNGSIPERSSKKELIESIKNFQGNVKVRVENDESGYNAFLTHKAEKDAMGSSKPAPVQEAIPSDPGTNPYADMGRLALIKVLRTNNVDYSHVSKDLEGLRALAMQTSSSQSAAPVSNPDPTPPSNIPEQTNPFVVPDEEPTNPPQASTPVSAPAESGDEYEGLGRLQLIKLCRERGLDYKLIAKNVEALRNLLRSS
eukprot:m.279354 g.279354  ORF g.279354 m.279354 type:complete len:1428 (+) comp16321_c1_seq34:142-4425(+)